MKSIRTTERGHNYLFLGDRWKLPLPLISVDRHQMFQSGSLIAYLCFNETVSVPNYNTAFNVDQAARFICVIREKQSNFCHSGCFWNICGFNLGFLNIFKSCVLVVFYSLKRIDPIWIDLL